MNDIYKETALSIIKGAIKSAVFIDEKARPFFQAESKTPFREEILSVELYENFRKEGISLDIHKFQLEDEKDSSLKDFLFEDRDLVLLDWNLNENSGEEFSLKMLADVVKRKHIHFCAIYTSEEEKDLDNIFRNILSYFSGETKDYYAELKENIEAYTEEVKLVDLLHEINLNRNNSRAKEATTKLFREFKKEIIEISNIINANDKKCSAIKASISLMETIKSEDKLPCPDFVSFENRTLVIDNTIITILNKDDNKPENLLKSIAVQIVNQETSFTQLLGLEMQTLFSRSSSFIDSSLLNVSKDSLLHHRRNFNSDGLSNYFPEFIKEVMLEKANINLRGESISLLKDEILDQIDNHAKPSQDEMVSMNIFYNSVSLKNGENLNFGDVFKVEGMEEYLICITALCDCLRPEKINNTYFFAKGTNISKAEAIDLQDTAFVSYLSNRSIVKWTEVNKFIKDEHHKYSPVYIKPVSFTVLNNQLDSEGKIFLYYIDKEGNKESITAKYITTLRTNYTQRIANHAFSYPIRVGVDFMKN